MALFSLYHLIYQSQANSLLQEVNLPGLLTQARQRNAALELTGVLLYCNGDIVQVLEGDKQAVHFVFSRIRQDVRHYNITVLADGPLRQRSFQDWSMGFTSVLPAKYQELQGYFDLDCQPYPQRCRKQPIRFCTAY